MRLTSTTLARNDSISERGNSFVSDANIRWFSSSLAEAMATCKNFAKSRSVARPHPSAMFDEIDSAARRAWPTTPVRSRPANGCVV